MPMDFPNERLLASGKSWFREKEEGETIEDYRKACAQAILDKDPIMANEILLGRGWDTWTEEETIDWLRRTPLHIVQSIPLSLDWWFKYADKLHKV
jgi:hypothetical protein